jgi:hypothetical protein
LAAAARAAAECEATRIQAERTDNARIVRERDMTLLLSGNG